MDGMLETAWQKKQARQLLKECTATLFGGTLAAIQKAQSRRELLLKKGTVGRRVIAAGLNPLHKPAEAIKRGFKGRVLAFGYVLYFSTEVFISNILALLDPQPRYLLDTNSLLGLQVISLSLFILVYMVMLGCKNFKD